MNHRPHEYPSMFSVMPSCGTGKQPFLSQNTASLGLPLRRTVQTQEVKSRQPRSVSQAMAYHPSRGCR